MVHGSADVNEGGERAQKAGKGVAASGLPKWVTQNTHSSPLKDREAECVFCSPFLRFEMQIGPNKDFDESLTKILFNLG